MSFDLASRQNSYNTMKKIICTLLLSVLFFSIHAQFSIDIESGIVFQGYNDVRIPNDPSQATKFSFTDDFDLQGPVIPFRLRLSYTIAEKNHFSLLYAPLSINYSGIQNKDINFQNTIFPSGENIEGLYKFNSYRFSFRRDLVSSEKWTLGLGITAKIRDARVSLANDMNSAKKDDLGFVPLINILVSYQPSKWIFILEGDGLGARQGRAFDFFLGTHFIINDKFTLKAGYRILEGGANVGEVYNFTLLNYGSIGIIWTIK